MIAYRFAFRMAAACLAACSCPAFAQTILFDFDTGSPRLSVGQSTPFDQTAGGVVARFSSPSGPAFSVQNDTSTGWHMSRFSSSYLSSNNQDRNALVIHFSRALSNIRVAFATADFHESELTTQLRLTAFLGSTGDAPVGSVTRRAAYSGDTMPMGELSLDGAGKPFDTVEIVVPAPSITATFMVDSVAVMVAAPAGSFNTVSAASFTVGSPLAPGSIASGFGRDLASSAVQAESLVPPFVLGGTNVVVKDSSGVERPAPLFYVSPLQVNYLVPEGLAPGQATVVVTNTGRVSGTTSVAIEAVAPGIFTANADGSGAPAGVAILVAPDLTQSTQPLAQCGTAAGSCQASPLDFGPAAAQLILVLYGTGIRGVASVAGVSIDLGGLAGTVLYAGPQSQFAGLDQLNVLVPRSLAGRGEVDVVLTVAGKAANTVRVGFR